MSPRQALSRVVARLLAPRAPRGATVPGDRLPARHGRELTDADIARLEQRDARSGGDGSSSAPGTSHRH